MVLWKHATRFVLRYPRVPKSDLSTGRHLPNTMNAYAAREVSAYTTEQSGTMRVTVTVRRLEPSISADVALDHQPLAGVPIGF